MGDEGKTKKQLLDELIQMRRRMAELEKAESERKQAEEALQQSESKYRTFFEQATDGIMMMPIGETNFTVNQSFAKLHGYGSPTEMEHLTLSDLDTPETARLAPERLRRLLTGESMNFEVEHYHKNGRKILLNVSCNVVQIAGKPYFLGFHQDITQRKRAEEALQEAHNELERRVEERTAELARANHALRESNMLFENLARVAPVGIFRTDTKGNCIYVNERWCQLTGIRSDEAHGECWFRAIHPEDRQRVGEEWTRCLENNLPFRSEYRFLQPDGPTRSLLGQASPEANYLGETVGYVGTITDITEQKQVEEALRESEVKFRALFDHSPVGISIAQKGVTLLYNEAGLRMFGYDDCSQVAGTPPLSRIAPHCREEISEYIRRRERGEAVPGTYETQGIRKDGSIFDLFIQGASIQLAGGQATVAFFSDITGRKAAERALVLADRYNRGLIEASPDSFFIIDFTGTITDVNTAAEMASGYSRGHLIGTDFCDYFTGPEKAREGCDKTIREGVVRDYELELHHAGGAITPVLLNASIFGNESDPTRGIFAVIRDISLHRHMEDALRKVNENLESLVTQRTTELAEKTRHLEEMNSALKVVLKQRELDKKELEDHILRNIKTLVLPYLEKLKMTRSPGDQANYLRILESNLEEVTSPFRATLAGAFAGLTPMEIRVANLIQEGLKTKEIARLLECSTNTVQAHRFNLRKKLELLGKGTNLRVFLGTLR